MTDIAIELPINWSILGSPLNWLIVVMVLVFVGYAAFIIHSNATSLTPNLA